MRNERNTKEDFVKGVSERIKKGTWGLDEVEYLNEYHAKYHLNYEDIGVFLSQIYQYTYQLALEDGLISAAENDQLADIMKLTMVNVPRNQAEREQFKFYILGLSRRFEKAHVHQEELQLEQELKEEQAMKVEPQPETVKQRVNRVYYKTPFPKCTPYTYY